MDIESKIRRWKQRLLDLGKRNPNLNFKFNKTSTLEITTPDYMELWEEIVEREKELSFGVYRGAYWGNTDDEEEEDGNSFIRADLTTSQSPTVQIKILRNLKKKAQTFSEEQGINVLYLCFGYLRYTEGRDEYMAPLLVVPVNLTCESITAPYKLALLDDEIIVNPTLKFKLEHDYNIILPEYDDNTKPEYYLSDMQKLVQRLKWIVKTNVGLGLLYFAKLAMYRDLEINHNDIAKSSLINVIAGNPMAHEQALPKTENLDENEQMKPINTFQVIDADTSQQEAILYAKKGISFVLQGPPGTGKSQTITNIIAEMLAARKKILFVSEKKAALDVVYKRLKEAGLDDFCLTMHDSKDSKLNTMNQFREILELASNTYNVKQNVFESLQQLEEDKAELNAYVRELHDKIGPLNRSIFDIHGELAALEKAPNVVFSIWDIRSISQTRFRDMLELIKRYEHSVSSMQDEVENNPWYGCNLTELTHEKSHDIDYNFDKVLTHITKATQLMQYVQMGVGYHIAPNYAGISEAEKVLSLARSAKNVPNGWILNNDLEPLYGEIDACNATKTKFLEIRNRVIDLHQQISSSDPSLNFDDYNVLSESSFINAHNDYITQIIRHDTLYSVVAIGDTLSGIDTILVELGETITKYKELRDKLTAKYEKELFTVAVSDILQRFKVDYTWGCLNILKGQYRADKKLFKGLLKQVGASISDVEIIQTLTDLKEYNELATLLDTNKSTYERYLGSNYKRENTDILDINHRLVTFRLIMQCNGEIENLRLIVNENEAREEILRKHYENLYSGIETDWESVRASLGWALALKNSLTNANENVDFIQKLCLADAATIAASANYYAQLADFKKQLDQVYLWVKKLFDDGSRFDNMPFNKLASRLKDCLDNKAILQDWVDYRKVLEECLEYGLRDFIKAIETEHIAKEQIAAAFKKRFYELWLDHAMLTHSKVKDFRGKLQNDRIKEFGKLDREQFAIARARTRATLINDLANHNIATNSVGDVAILKKELNKKRKIMPIRRLFNKIPKLVMMLKPCLMMSPLTVSLYLQSREFEFDVVIFDEASQVCTENAIGAIMRGKQVIIAGDSKQLPPTNFFRTSTDNDTDEYDEENEDNNDVFESLLDEAALLPSRTLLWHYRSKHEHLITFSNRKIYNNSLITFPSNREKGPDLGVEYEYVPNGCYDRGGRKGNVIEAQRVAELVFEHFKKCAKGDFERSLGVIAFGEAQAQAIEAALRQKRQEDGSLEGYFNENLEDPFFIKSLENVQGDERDTIIFSIGYAKDANGVMHMFFGPLSQAGGERRLNVAITRAKYNVKLVGSILPSDIDTERVTSEGPKLLRSYIDFAQRGIRALDTETSSSEDVVFDSPFEESVYKFLVENGYNVRTQVGCSSYRIDLAIRHPNISDCFVLGIECDGATYHSAKNARERDRLRQDVLENMGWQIYRIWSTDWIKDSVTEGKRLIDAIEKAMISFGVDEKYPVETIEVETDSLVTKVEKTAQEEANQYGFEEYPVFSNMDTYGDETKIREKIVQFVKQGYPLALDQLYKETCTDYGVSRITSKVKENINFALSALRNEVIVKDNFVYPKEYTSIAVRKAGPRKIDYIAKEELAEGILKVIQANYAMNRDELIAETAKAFGFTRKGQNITAALGEAFDYLCFNKRIRWANNKVTIVEKKPVAKPVYGDDNLWYV